MTPVQRRLRCSSSLARPIRSLPVRRLPVRRGSSSRKGLGPTRTSAGARRCRVRREPRTPQPSRRCMSRSRWKGSCLGNDARAAASKRKDRAEECPRCRNDRDRPSPPVRIRADERSHHPSGLQPSWLLGPREGRCGLARRPRAAPVLSTGRTGCNTRHSCMPARDGRQRALEPELLGGAGALDAGTALLPLRVTARLLRQGLSNQSGAIPRPLGAARGWGPLRTG